MKLPIWTASQVNRSGAREDIIQGDRMAESYSKLFSIRVIGLRFFTVYGPWGRPDMAIWQSYGLGDYELL